MNDLLLRLRDKGNTVLVVEHDPETIAAPATMATRSSSRVRLSTSSPLTDELLAAYVGT